MHKVGTIHNNKIKFYLPLFLVVCISVLRFANLEADFPAGITWSTALYTDEGLWARNAVAALRNGAWYVEDGYNPILSVPVVPLLQMLWFKLFGVSLVAARSLVATSSIALMGLVYALLRCFLQQELALWGPLVIASSYSFFAYSRIALLEIPMLVFGVLSLLIVLRRRDSRYADIVASAVMLYLGILAKTTALFVLPSVYLALFMQPAKGSRKILKLLTLTLTLLGLSALYYVFVLQPFASNAQTFSNTNISSQVAGSSWNLISELKAIARVSLGLYPLLLPASVGAAFLLLCLRSYRFNTLFLVACFWTLGALVVLASTHYHPSRYFMILIIPMALIVPLAMQAVVDQLEVKRIGRAFLASVVTLVLVFNLSHIVLYMAQPQFTFVRMAESVGAYMHRLGDQRSARLMGEFADTVSLVSTIAPVDLKRGSLDTEARIKRFKPQFFLSLGEIDGEDLRSLRQYYSLELIKVYDVFDNYAMGKQVFFYRLNR